MTDKQDYFTTLNNLNVSDKVEKKDNQNYLSWAWAWGEFLKVCPNATYKVIKNENGLPYFADNSGAMVYTEVTVDGLTKEMWLPVINGANKAMKSHPYKYATKYGEKTVEAYTMFDVNKTVMRCLTKNLAMFGLGLYIYAKEDLPEEEILAASSELQSLINNCKTRDELTALWKEKKPTDKDIQLFTKRTSELENANS